MKNSLKTMLIISSLACTPFAFAHESKDNSNSSISHEHHGKMGDKEGMMGMMQEMHENMGEMMKNMTAPEMKKKMEKMHKNMGQMMKEMKDKCPMMESMHKGMMEEPEKEQK